MALFLKECAIYEIPVETLVHRKVGNPVEDLKYDLEHAEDLGKFQSILAHSFKNSAIASSNGTFPKFSAFSSLNFSGVKY